MDCVSWPRVSEDLASTRRAVAAFLEDFDAPHSAACHSDWVVKWTKIGDAHILFGDANVQKGQIGDAEKAWLCALTAFELARRLAREEAAESEKVTAKIASAVRKIGSLDRRIERVQVECFDQSDILAYYLPAAGRSKAPAVICISTEEETVTTLLGRILPVLTDRGISVLVVAHEDISNFRSQSDMALSCCLDYLSARSDVDAARIGVYGDGLSAALATELVLSDRRVAAAVCDGGLWILARMLASIQWLTGTSDFPDDKVVSSRRSRMIRQFKCPVLVVASARGMVSLPETSKLLSQASAASIDLQLVMPRTMTARFGEIEDFVTFDERIFGWLEDKLVPESASQAC
ncbi:hypothetical protein IVB16_31570 [Bradyrhizobium sp. 183]|uniref:hypothetical protein n=1 Tax=unclassified Bradyrhizobium TaxID=2631580 RepID=UPI001FFF6371|nr:MULTISPECIES: hypothetical protein [unclassified Bradyrhizobium]UPJ79275.1 hypothetical protein IVB17_31570 [Bradyrhizobium sp. 184]UPJ87068.1 hypothetical protein IVB16_31570 [Bradyrhizobium sp. 183]